MDCFPLVLVSLLYTFIDIKRAAGRWKFSQIKKTPVTLRKRNDTGGFLTFGERRRFLPASAAATTAAAAGEAAAASETAAAEAARTGVRGNGNVG